MCTQIQLLSLLNLCNGACPLRALAVVRAAKNLPIRAGQTAPELQLEVKAWVASLDENPFSPRYQAVKANSWISGGTAAAKQVDLVARGVFTREDIEWYLHFKTVEGKLQWLGRKPSYAADPEHSFVACNLLSLLHAVGGKFPHLRCLRLPDLSKLPDGPGAVNFYSVADTSRADLLRKVTRWLPSTFRLGRRSLPMHLQSMDEQVVQFNVCAAWRMMNFIFSGSLLAHLKRNAVLQA